MSMPVDRREFLVSAGVAALFPSPLLGAQPAAGVELGSIDGSVGGNQFTPTQFLDYLSSIKLTWAMISLPPATLANEAAIKACLLYTSPSPRDRQKSRMPSSA